MKTSKNILLTSYFITFLGIWIVGYAFAYATYCTYTDSYPCMYDIGERYYPITGFGKFLCLILGGLFVHLPIITNWISVYNVNKMRDGKLKNILRVLVCLGAIFSMVITSFCVFGLFLPDPDNKFYGMFSILVGGIVSVLLILSLMGLAVTSIVRYSYRRSD